MPGIGCCGDGLPAAVCKGSAQRQLIKCCLQIGRCVKSLRTGCAAFCCPPLLHGVLLSALAARHVAIFPHRSGWRSSSSVCGPSAHPNAPVDVRGEAATMSLLSHTAGGRGGEGRGVSCLTKHWLSLCSDCASLPLPSSSYFLYSLGWIHPHHPWSREKETTT